MCSVNNFTFNDLIFGDMFRVIKYKIYDWNEMRIASERRELNTSIAIDDKQLPSSLYTKLTVWFFMAIQLKIARRRSNRSRKVIEWKTLEAWKQRTLEKQQYICSSSSNKGAFQTKLTIIFGDFLLEFRFLRVFVVLLSLLKQDKAKSTSHAINIWIQRIYFLQMTFFNDSHVHVYLKHTIIQGKLLNCETSLAKTIFLGNAF